MSDVAMDTPDASQTTGGVANRANKPDTYHGDRKKLEAWLLQVDRYFHLAGDRIEDSDKVVLATTYLRGDAEKWANPILRRYMDDAIKDDENAALVEDWDAFKKKMQENFSPIKESMIAEQKIQTLRQIKSAAEYTTEFQQYATAIEWDNNALMRMYRQGLKPTVRRELMRSGAKLDTLDELTAEAIRLDNDLYELALEERIFTQGTRTPGPTNDRPRQQSRRSYPNQGRQRSYTPRVPGQYATNGYEPMHLDNINKGPGKPKFQHDKSKNKKITCYGCGKEGHMARDCRSKNKVVRQLNVLRREVPNIEDEAWNVITRPSVNLQGQADGIVNGLEDLTLITQDEPSSDNDTPEDDPTTDEEVEEIDHTKYGKQAKFKEVNRPPTPHNNIIIQCPQYLNHQINALRRQLNKPELVFEDTPKDFYADFKYYNEYVDLLEEVQAQGLTPDVGEDAPTKATLEWVYQAQESWKEPTYQLSDIERQEIYDEVARQSDPQWAPIEEAEYEAYKFWRQGNTTLERQEWAERAYCQWKDNQSPDKPEWAKIAQKNWKRDCDARKKQRAADTHYWMDYRNPEHARLSFSVCIHDTCPIHYSEKTGSSWYPSKIRGYPTCKWFWYECRNDECPRHLWDKRTATYFVNHMDPQEVIQMQTVHEAEVDGVTIKECSQPSWHTCLADCDWHRIAKDFHGYGKSFLDQRSHDKELARRLTL
jgi:hypothetical protein